MNDEGVLVEFLKNHFSGTRVDPLQDLTNTCSSPTITLVNVRKNKYLSKWISISNISIIDICFGIFNIVIRDIIIGIIITIIVTIIISIIIYINIIITISTYTYSCV